MDLNQALSSGGLTFSQPRKAAQTFSQATGLPYYSTTYSNGQGTVTPQYTLGNGQAVTQQQFSQANPGYQNTPGDSELDQLRKMQQSGGLNPVQQSRLNELTMPDEYSRQIDEAYNSSMGVLDQAENYLKGYQPQYEQQITNDYNYNVNELGNQRQSAFDRFGLQETQAQRRKEDALSAARRVYQEQTLGANQRFGGSSSAGGAVSEILARSQAEEQGKTYRQYNDYAQNLEIQRGEVERSYNLGLEKIRLEKERSLLESQRDFQSKLLQIASDKSNVIKNKAEARLQALQELRARAFSIEQMDRQFQYQLALQKQQNLASLNNFSSSLSNSNSIVDQAYNQVVNGTSQAPAPVSISSGGIQNPLQYIGQLFGQKKDDYLYR